MCIRPPLLNHRVDETLAQMQKDVRNKYYWAKRAEINEEEEEEGESEERTYEPKFYLLSKWKPPKLTGAEKYMEDKLIDFRDTTFQQMNEMNQNKRPRNLPMRVMNIARKLQADKTLTVVLTDKGQRPAIMEKDNYNFRVWKNNLSKTETYKQLGAAEAKDRMKRVATHLEKITRINLPKLREHEGITFLRSFEPQRQRHYKVPQCYLMPKPHKGTDAVE